MLRELSYAALGTGFTCLATVLGAAMVFFFRRELGGGVQKVFLGFAAGVMTAASVWSLLLPAIDRAAELGLPGWLPPAAGLLLFLTGCHARFAPGGPFFFCQCGSIFAVHICSPVFRVVLSL